MTFVLSLVLGIIPLLGIVWILLSGTADTVDGLFLGLILLTLSGILLLNAAWEAHARGYLNFARRKKPGIPEGQKSQIPQTRKTSVGAEAIKADEATAQKPAGTPAQKTT